MWQNSENSWVLCHAPNPMVVAKVSFYNKIVFYKYFKIFSRKKYKCVILKKNIKINIKYPKTRVYWVGQT